MSTSERAQSDFKKLKSKYTSQLSTLRELFTEWTEEDLLFTLQDADGDLELAIDRISEGHASQWGEVKTKKSKKEAAAANKATLEVSTSSTTTISYPPAVTRPAASSSRVSAASSSATPTSTKRPSANSRQKPTQTSTWQSKKLDDSCWNSKDNWNTNDAWSQSKDPISIAETPKKISTPSPSTKTSNAGGAKTWASLLHTKPEPVVEAEPVKEEEKTQTHHEPELQKVDDAWLSSDSKWDQPLQLPTLLDKTEDEVVVLEKEQPVTPPPSTAPTAAAPAAVAPTVATPTAAPVVTPVASVAPSQVIEKEISVDFGSLSLQEAPETTSSSHPSVADILNSVKQQPSTSNTTDTTSSTTTQPPIDQHLYQQQQQQQHHHQQQQQHHQQQHLYNQQQQYQQFGIQDYNPSFNANDYGSSNYYGQEDKTDLGSHTYSQQPLYNQTPQQQQQQSFYPYYYMPNQFNAYSPYGQQPQAQTSGANAFMNGRNNMYPTSVYGQQQKTTTSSPYLNSSPYSQTQQLYGGFNQFYGSPQVPVVGNESPEKSVPTTAAAAAAAKSPAASTQAYGSTNYFGQSPMFGYQQQQQQQQQQHYRTGNTNQYWNQ
ncbi:hypothetical protein INT47_002547 [Mucor saturninus]|uniref:RNA polymerase II degradation factor 1 n=1 Tax=Mucor saturninus TaxID=64648 RepID=A0A8H7UNV3_9FUNG|nr:hypothetical protein INT47_002547 [Mucor saturninus]